MASLKFLMVSIVVALVIFGVGADSGIKELRSRLSALESSVSERIQDIKKKDQSILNFENVIKEKSARIFSLQSEIELLRKQVAADAEQSVERVHKKASEMEKQVAWLKNEIKAQTMRRGALEARGAEAEKKAQELKLKLEILKENYDKQKLQIKSTERDLQVAEEELMKAQLEAASKLKKLTEVHEAWLPPWLALYMSHCTEVAATHWNKHGKPVLVGFFQKASERSALVQKWTEPHLHTTQTKWIPAAKERMTCFASNVHPYAQLLSAKTMEVYMTSKINIATNIMKAQELAYHYFLVLFFISFLEMAATSSYSECNLHVILLVTIVSSCFACDGVNLLQEARKFSKPYVDQIANVAKPHVEKLQVILDPYHKLVVHSYKRLAKTTLTYHNQVKVRVHENLKKHELTKPVATMELSWFLASAILASPMFFLFRLLSAIFCKKTNRGQHAKRDEAPNNHKRNHGGK